jgi:hypothetical protein
MITIVIHFVFFTQTDRLLFLLLEEERKKRNKQVMITKCVSNQKVVC